MPDGRNKPFVLSPLYQVSQAPAAALAFLARAAQVLGHGAVFQRWWCPTCQYVYAWPDMVVGQVQGTEMWLVVCATQGCPGADWIQLRNYDRERHQHPAWPAEPQSGELLPVATT